MNIDVPSCQGWSLHGVYGHKGLKKRVYLQFYASIDMPSDAQRIQKVKLLLDNGHASKVLLSQAIHTKHRLVSHMIMYVCVVSILVM